MDPAILWRLIFHLSSCAPEEHGSLLSKAFGRFTAGQPLMDSQYWMSSVISSPSACFFTLGLPQVNKHPSFLTVQAPGSLKANFWKPFSYTLKFKAGVVADSLPSLWHRLRCQIQLDPLYLPTHSQQANLFKGCSHPLHSPAPNLQSPFIIFKYKYLCFTKHPPNSDLQRPLPSPCINLPAQPCTHARLIYLLSSTYFMSACLCLFHCLSPHLSIWVCINHYLQCVWLVE